jgi:hypothetical protein
VQLLNTSCSLIEVTCMCCCAARRMREPLSRRPCQLGRRSAGSASKSDNLFSTSLCLSDLCLDAHAALLTAHRLIHTAQQQCLTNLTADDSALLSVVCLGGCAGQPAAVLAMTRESRMCCAVLRVPMNSHLPASSITAVTRQAVVTVGMALDRHCHVCT